MTVVVCDTETTGITNPIPVEVAWATFGDGAVLGPINARRFNPGKLIEFGAMATHHITDAMVADEELWGAWALPSDTEFLIGHNVDYDWEAIGRPEVKRVCTLALARAIWPTLDSHKLGALIYFLEPDEAPRIVPQAHGAAADVAMVEMLLPHIIKARPEIKGWRSLHAASEVARIPTVISFGKHKGTAIADLPSGYVDWCLKQPDFDPYLIKALQAAHGGRG